MLNKYIQLIIETNKILIKHSSRQINDELHENTENIISTKEIITLLNAWKEKYKQSYCNSILLTCEDIKVQTTRYDIVVKAYLWQGNNLTYNYIIICETLYNRVRFYIYKDFNRAVLNNAVQLTTEQFKLAMSISNTYDEFITLVFKIGNKNTMQESHQSNKYKNRVLTLLYKWVTKFQNLSVQKFEVSQNLFILTRIANSGMTAHLITYNYRPDKYGKYMFNIWFPSAVHSAHLTEQQFELATKLANTPAEFAQLAGKMTQLK